MSEHRIDGILIHATYPHPGLSRADIRDNRHGVHSSDIELRYRGVPLQDMREVSSETRITSPSAYRLLYRLYSELRKRNLRGTTPT